jgi:hypothetical protein
VIQVQVFAIKNFAAILAGVAVALENIVTRELHFLLRHAVEEHQQNHARDANAKRDRVDALGMRFLLREVVPLAEIKSLKEPSAPLRTTWARPSNRSVRALFAVQIFTACQRRLSTSTCWFNELMLSAISRESSIRSAKVSMFAGFQPLRWQVAHSLFCVKCAMRIKVVFLC